MIFMTFCIDIVHNLSLIIRFNNCRNKHIQSIVNCSLIVENRFMFVGKSFAKVLKSLLVVDKNRNCALFHNYWKLVRVRCRSSLNRCKAYKTFSNAAAKSLKIETTRNDNFCIISLVINLKISLIKVQNVTTTSPNSKSKCMA